MTRVGVAGATGLVGQQVARMLEEQGHEVVPLSRRTGHDLLAPSEALAGVLDDCYAVVDALNTPTDMTSRSSEFFTKTTRKLLAAEVEAGVRHHVLLSIVGIDGIDDLDHYLGKKDQEALVEDGPVPWSIVRTTQFHEFAEMAAAWSTHDGVATLAPLVLQPVASAEVAQYLAEVAVGPPLGRARELAGPESHSLVDLARRSLASRGHMIEVRTGWDGQPFGRSMAGDAMLPRGPYRRGSIRFDAWLDERAGG